MKIIKYIYLITILSSNFFFFPVKSDSMFDMGKNIFLNKGNCVACHTLNDAESNGLIGPNLNQIKPDKMRVISTVTNGIGVMPAYEGQLSMQEIEAVAHYVSISANY